MKDEFVLQVGDEVEIQDKAFLEAHRGESPTVNSSMLKYAGRVGTIVDMETRNNCGVKYAIVRLSVDNGNWWWRISWLSPVACPIEPDAFEEVWV